ncbi:MAG: recombinase family protein [Clostridia bacterium]|nr:recombinase family protein [Clostridia bacterium]
MIGVIYARYSSDNQREESIEGQIRECQAFARKNDITLLEPYIDRALSARSDNRPNFQKMIKDSAAKKFDVVIVWKLDRFARNRYDSAHYKSVLRKNGVRVMSATEAISEGAEGILLESMLEGMAEYYSAELSEKVVRGLTENALKCKYNGGKIPIGYQIDENQFYQINPITAPAVLEAFQKYANGATMQEITEELNIKGIRTTQGTKVTLNTVTRMLHNRKYIGEYQYRDVVIPNGIPAIIPASLFEQVQERAASNKKAPAKHKAEDEYLLTTKLFCGYCGCLMTGESGTSHTQEVHRYYKCRGARKGEGCTKKTVRKYWIEDVVIGLIQKFIFDDELLDKLADTLVERLGVENTTLPILRRQLAEVEKGIENLLNAIQAGIFTSSTKQRLETLEAEKQELSVQIIKEEVSKPSISKEEILFYLTKYRKLNMKQLDHRRRLIDSFVNAIYLFDDKLVITFNYKEGTKTITFAEIEQIFGSDLSSLSAPKNRRYRQVSPVFSCGTRIVQASCERIGKCRFFWGCGKLKTCSNPVKALQVLLPAP